jgi:hypothetical protein
MATVTLSDDFSSPNGFVDYDHVVANVSTDAEITNRYINIRNFDNGGLIRQATQADLDNHLQFDAETQGQVESIQTVPGESWTMISRTNVNAWGTPPAVTEVGKMSGFSQWYGAIMTQSGGGTPSVTIGSNTDSNPLDISNMDYISLIGSLSTTASGGATIAVYLEDAVGANTGFISLTSQQPTSIGAEWRAPIGSFTGINLTRVTRVQIRVTSTSTTAGSQLRVAYLRAYKTGFNPDVRNLINTRRGVVEYPMGHGFSNGSTPADGPKIRGRGQPGDPTPENVELRMLIQLGTLSGSNNTVSLIYRQIQGQDTYVRVDFVFNSSTASYSIYNRVNGTDNAVVLNRTISEWPTIRSAGYFWLAGKLIDNTYQMRIYISDANEEVLALAHDETATQYAALAKRRGRVGWNANLVGQSDHYLRAFQGFAFTFSSFITKTNNTITPIEAISLQAAAAADTNLFTNFVSGATFDGVKTLSGNGSWQGSGPAISNQFVIDDFAVTYLKFDIWVPTGSAGSPYLSLRPLGGASNIYLPPLDDLQPGIWNNVEIELSQYQGLIGVAYELHIADLTQESPLTWQFNIDNMMIGRRNIAWYASPDDGVNWYEFRDAVNDPNAVLHFPRISPSGGVGRGTALKFRAEARSAEAWIASFAYQILYAQLGRPTYYT